MRYIRRLKFYLIDLVKEKMFYRNNWPAAVIILVNCALGLLNWNYIAQLTISSSHWGKAGFKPSLGSAANLINTLH